VVVREIQKRFSKNDPPSHSDVYEGFDFPHDFGERLPVDFSNREVPGFRESL